MIEYWHTITIMGVYGSLYQLKIKNQ